MYSHTFDSHKAMLRCTLKDSLGFQILGMSRILNVGANPTNILAPTNRVSSQLLISNAQKTTHLLKPHFLKQTRPISSPSELPHHKNTKLLWAATSPMSRFIIWSHDQNWILVTPMVRWYSSNGGSIKITSNLLFICLRSYVFKSHLRYIGGVAVVEISSSFNLMSSRSLGYSSKRSARPTSRIKFCGRWPVSTKCWQ